MATGARRFAEEQVLPSLLRRGGALGIHLAVKPKLRCRGEVQECLDLCHEMHLAAWFEHVDPLLCRDHRIAIEVGRALVELRKILHTLHRPLRSEQPSDVRAAQPIHPPFHVATSATCVSSGFMAWLRFPESRFPGCLIDADTNPSPQRLKREVLIRRSFLSSAQRLLLVLPLNLFR